MEKRETNKENRTMTTKQVLDTEEKNWAVYLKECKAKGIQPHPIHVKVHNARMIIKREMGL